MGSVEGATDNSGLKDGGDVPEGAGVALGSAVVGTGLGAMLEESEGGADTTVVEEAVEGATVGWVLLCGALGGAVGAMVGTTLGPAVEVPTVGAAVGIGEVGRAVGPAVGLVV